MIDGKRKTVQTGGIIHIPANSLHSMVATDDEDVAWLAETHARMEGCKISDIIPLDRHHFTPETPDLYGE